MSIVLPATTVAYQSPINSLPARWDLSDQSYRPPPEGSRFIPFEIDWGDYISGSGIACNAYGNQPNAQLTRIVALSVDNVDCGSDVQFVFPDTAEVLTVPAYASGVFPIFTGATAFYVIAVAPVSNDVTRFKVHNTLPPPVAIEKTEFQATSATTGASLGAVSSTQMIPAGISGTLEAISIGLIITNLPTGGGEAVVSLQDGTGKSLWVGTIGSANNNAGAPVSFNLSDLRVRFTNGLSFEVLAALPATGTGSATVALYYQVP